MKKLLMMLVIMAFAAPIYAADVDFAAVTDGQTVTITYTINIGSVVSMALNVDADVYITSCTADPPFDLLILDQVTSGEISLPSNSFCISMFNVEGTSSSGQIVLTAAAAGTGTLDLNLLHGGVINTDGQAMTTNLPILIAFEETITECIPVGHPDYVDWQAVGKPQSWCWETQCYGDADGSASGSNCYGVGCRYRTYINSEDIDILLAGFRQAYTGTESWIIADFDRRENSYGPDDRFKARVSTEDVNILIANFRQTVPKDCNDMP